MCIFVIEKIWINPLENYVGNAVGYSLHSYVNTNEEADEICKSGRDYSGKDCWAIMNTMKEYRYFELKYFKDL